MLKIYSEIWLPDLDDSEKWLSSLFNMRLNCKQNKQELIISNVSNATVNHLLLHGSFLAFKKEKLHFLYINPSWQFIICSAISNKRTHFPLHYFSLHRTCMTINENDFFSRIRKSRSQSLENLSAISPCSEDKKKIKTFNTSKCDNAKISNIWSPLFP